MTKGAVILGIKARQVLDSRGNPTVEADVKTRSSLGRASVPSGASTGSHEALELRDGDQKTFLGRGVLRAVSNVESVIGPALNGVLVAEQRKIDRIMIREDGTPNKSRLGANAILAVSMAAAKAAALERRLPLFGYLKERKRYRLPVPMMNVINGGEHAGNDLAIQEFHIEPVGAESCSDAIRIGAEVYQTLKGVLKSEHGESAINVGDEGGFAPPLSQTKDALDAISKAITKAGYSEADVRLGIDAAASTFFDPQKKTYAIDGKMMGSEELEEYYAGLVSGYNLLTIEDPFYEGSVDDFARITKRLGKKVMIIGDDIYVTNLTRIEEGIKMRATNAVLIKLNQIGTVTETVEAIETSRRAGWMVTISHRSGETEDPFIAHLATAYGSEFIKTGAPARGERTAKYNELLRIEEGLGNSADYAGKSFD
jgi:enolase